MFFNFNISIHEHGYWQGEDTSSKHRYDDSLVNSLVFYPTRKEGELNPLYDLAEVLIGYINPEKKQILTKEKVPTTLKKLISS